MNLPLSPTSIFRVCLATVAIGVTIGCSSPSDPSPTASTTALDGPGGVSSTGASAGGQTAGQATTSGTASVPTVSTGR